MVIVSKKVENKGLLGGKPVRITHYKTGEALIYNRITKQWEATNLYPAEAHIIDANGTLGDITTKFNTLLSQLETLGLLDTS